LDVKVSQGVWYGTKKIVSLLEIY